MERIEITDFYKNAEYTVGKVYHTELIYGTKLLKLLVDFGDVDKTIVSDIGEDFRLKLIGIHTIFITNFPNVIIKGIESEGMLFYGKKIDGAKFVVNLGNHIEVGSRLG
jgi:tRNA-binding EMAP/Myf-like protein